MRRNARAARDRLYGDGMISFPYQNSQSWRVQLGKYDPLASYLAEQSAGTCTLTFREVEDIIGDSLPNSAREPRNYESWWANDRTHVQASSWLDAGWSTQGKPDLREERIRFVRTESNRSAASSGSGRSQVIVRNLDVGVVSALKQQAQRNGRSLERELRILLTRAARPDRTQLMVEADRIRAMSAGPLADSVTLLREDRDRR